MIVDTRMHPIRALRAVWPTALMISAYSVAVVIMHDRGDVAIPLAVPTVLGTAISILLGFKTSAAYDRWWEARKIWGAIVNDSRTFGRQIVTLLAEPPDSGAPDTRGSARDGSGRLRRVQRELLHRHIAWLGVHRDTLRGLDPADAMEGLLDPAEIRELSQRASPPSALLQIQTRRLRELLDEGFIDRVLFLPVEYSLRKFSEHLGAGERIKKTVFPPQYGYMLTQTILLFNLLLPLGLVDLIGWASAPVAILTGLVFVLVHSMGAYLKDPFENAETDTPMTAICRSIEIDLRQMLGETELPEPIGPEDGVLM